MLTALATFTFSAAGCSEGESRTCYQIIEEYQSCMDEFCSVEGAGTEFCDCWIRGYGASSSGCNCEGTIWITSARGLCDTLGADHYSELIDCSSGVTYARGWIDDCG